MALSGYNLSLINLLPEIGDIGKIAALLFWLPFDHACLSSQRLTKLWGENCANLLRVMFLWGLWWGKLYRLAESDVLMRFVMRNTVQTCWEWCSYEVCDEENYADLLRVMFLWGLWWGKLCRLAESDVLMRFVMRKTMQTCWEWCSYEVCDEENYADLLRVMFLWGLWWGKLCRLAESDVLMRFVMRKTMQTCWEWCSYEVCDEENYADLLRVMFLWGLWWGKLCRLAESDVLMRFVMRKTVQTCWEWCSYEVCDEENYADLLRVMFLWGLWWENCADLLRVMFLWGLWWWKLCRLAESDVLMRFVMRKTMQTCWEWCSYEVCEEENCANLADRDVLMRFLIGKTVQTCWEWCSYQVVMRKLCKLPYD